MMLPESMYEYRGKEESDIVAECCWCDKPIKAVDGYYNIRGDIYCNDCIEDCKTEVEPL